MITIKNVKTLSGETVDYTVASSEQRVLEANEQLLLLPALCDPHISFGSLGSEEWKFALRSVLKGGITSAIDIYEDKNFLPLKKNLENHQQAIDQALSALHLPLGYQFYARLIPNQIDQLGQIKNLIKGVIIRTDYMDPEEDVFEEKNWDRIFQLAAWEDVLVVMNSRGENGDPKYKMANRNLSFLEKALNYVEKHSARLCFLNVSSKEEIDLIKQAKGRELLVFAETTPKYLFPPKLQEADSLWRAIEEGTIDMIGSGYHADLLQHEETAIFNGKSYHFLNPIFLLPLLMSAFRERNLSIDKLIRMTRFNVQDICELKDNQDVVLVDLSRQQKLVRNSNDRSIELLLSDWPAYTIVQGQVFAFD